MNIFKKVYGRIFQKIMYVASMFLNFRKPTILRTNENVLDILVKLKKQNILILTSNPLIKTIPYQNLENVLKKKLNVFVYLDIPSDPDVIDIEKAISFAKENNIDSIVAIGGGSIMDAGKVIAARLADLKRSIAKMKGLLKIRKKPLTLIAVPTTAGTGSECTVAAVVSDKKNNQKYAINDPKLIPYYTLHNPEFLYSMPSFFTSTTGLDALTHAIEAFIGKSNTKETFKNALTAIKLIDKSLVLSYKEPTNKDARTAMQEASYLAGCAFTRAYVGYVHAISHALAAKYHLPHGYLNAIVLPIVLEEYGSSINKKLNIISKELSGNQNINFITYIKELLEKLEIKNTMGDVIKESDYPDMLKHINAELYPLYPVPKYFSNEDLIKIFNRIKNNA